MFSLIIGLHLGRHLGSSETLNDARVASLGFFKDNVYSTRISKEKKFKIKFQVLLKLARILLDYMIDFRINMRMKSTVMAHIFTVHILNKSENATLQLSMFYEKVLCKKYLLKLNNVAQTSSKRFVETPPICLV